MAPTIDLGAFSGNQELEQGVLQSLVLDNHQPEELANKAEAYGSLDDKAALGVQVAINPDDGNIQGSTFRFMGRNNALIMKTSAIASDFWECSKSYKLSIKIGVKLSSDYQINHCSSHPCRLNEYM